MNKISILESKQIIEDRKRIKESIQKTELFSQIKEDILKLKEPKKKNWFSQWKYRKFPPINFVFWEEGCDTELVSDIYNDVYHMVVSSSNDGVSHIYGDSGLLTGPGDTIYVERRVMFLNFDDKKIRVDVANWLDVAETIAKKYNFNTIIKNYLE